MNNMSELYRQYIPDLDLSIERYTEAVPSDGKYHVLRNGEIFGSFRYLKQAQDAFRKLVQESGFKPNPSRSKGSASQTMTDQYLETKELYWADSYKHRPRGGGGR